MIKGKHILLKLIATLLVFGVLFFLLQRLVVPKYTVDLKEGSLIREYYDEEEKDFDVILIGNCELYENFSPLVMWENYGINSYIRGSAEQYLPQTYYLLKDTLRYETPKVMVFNVRSLLDVEARTEAYNRMTMDGMRWSKTKIDCIQASKLPEEHMVEYIFPLLRCHSRINELDATDFQYMFKHKKVAHNGFFFRVDTLPVGKLPSVKPLGNYSMPDGAWEYLDAIRETCEENDMKLLLIKAPSVYPHWYDEWDEQVVKYADEHDLVYVNMLNYVDEIGIDYETDTYDGGLHMNLSGAEKCSVFLGDVMVRNYGLKDRRGEEELAARWAEKKKLYDEEIQYQKELYGCE